LPPNPEVDLNGPSATAELQKVPELTSLQRSSVPARGSVTSVAAVAVAVIGAVVLVGWATGIEPLTSIIPGRIIMIPNTATGFLLAGVSLWLLRNPIERSRARANVARAAAAVVLVLGVLTFIERVTGANFGIDLLLFADAVRTYPYLPPGQMASNSTVCFTLAGLSLLTLDLTRWRGFYPHEWFAAAGLGVSLLALMGYLFGATSMYTFDSAAGMALLTASSFATLHTGLLVARPQRGVVTLITGTDAAANLVRRLLLAAIGVPIVLGWLWLRARQLDLMSLETAIGMMVLATILILVGVVVQSGRALRKTDLVREALLVGEGEARAAAERASRVKSEFLATMSHELRTPLNAIIGYSSLMAEGLSGALTDTQREQLGRISISARHLLTLIDEILTLARMDAGTETVHLREVSLAGLFEETASIAEPMFAQKQLRFRSIGPPPILLRSDPDRLRQILLNLLSNAAKFTDRGEVVMRASEDPGTGCVRIEVKDSGIGISAANLAQVFEPFWQVETTAAKRAAGTGLGLAVSRRLARLLRGDIEVSSTLGEGSTFAVVVPMHDGIEPPCIVSRLDSVVTGSSRQKA
jgi:signal transduction histidine kinase